MTLEAKSIKGARHPDATHLVPEASGLFDPKTYGNFRARVEQSRDRLMTLAYQAHAKGQRFVGNSCPGRCSTLRAHYTHWHM